LKKKVEVEAEEAPAAEKTTKKLKHNLVSDDA
jgi:hypothetical protein